ncbi:hypothetical protein JCM19235_1324 [Vibrio maritimus]|uniref:Uncharacterized protein n=1 Tax=Vibrio maritimus TaxID=990268 RepID=A0A090S8C4_9VIBR|nr:hypothetical protein JCM19235_1324 [Vibrio maritimus]
MSKGYRREGPNGAIVVDCPYCGSRAKRVGGDVIYPHRRDLAKKHFYLCENGHDRAYVGCHPRTIIPLGRLADAKLRADKSAAHAAFDPIWREHKFMKRTDAYKWLSEQLNIDREHCHIGMFDRVTCRRVVETANNYLEDMGVDLPEAFD